MDSLTVILVACFLMFGLHCVIETSLPKMAAFAEISSAQTKIFQVQVHKNVSSAPRVQHKVRSSVLNK